MNKSNKSTLIGVIVAVSIIVVLGILILAQAVQPILVIPLFLVLLSPYLAYMGWTAESKEFEITSQNTFYFVWSAISLSIGASWVLLSYSVPIAAVVIVIAMIILLYVALNWARTHAKNKLPFF